MTEGHKGDLRKNERFSVRWRGRVLLADKTLHPIRISDVSKGGIAIGFYQALPHRSQVQVEMQVPLKGAFHRIRAKCIVVHQTILSENRGAKIGLQFTEMKNEDIHALSNALQALSDQQA